MKGLVCYGARDIRYETLDDPKIVSADQAIVKLTKCAICGSDMHFYHGHVPVMKPFSIGHEAIGEVVEVGKDVRRVKVGDQVMLPASTGCGHCRACHEGWVNKCETYGAMRIYGLGMELAGCQAEMLLVRDADYNAVPIPDGVTPDQALMCVDILPTAYVGCVNADIAPGKTVAVVGLGPIGILAVDIALLMGASRVFGIDFVPERRALGEKHGATVLEPGDAEMEIREATDGRMVDCAIELVGAEKAIDSAIALVGQHGTTSVMGAGVPVYNFPMMASFMKGLTMRVTVASVPVFLPQLIKLIQSGRLQPEKVITHRLKLSEGAKGYDMFDKREGGVLKIYLEP